MDTILQVGLVYANTTPQIHEYVATAQRVLGEHGVQATPIPLISSAEKDEFTLPQTLNAIIAFGGDGTILSTAREASRKGIPVLGVNCGQLGFLSEVGVKDIACAVDKLIHGQYDIEKRIMLTACYQGKEIIALNDLVIRHASAMRAIRAKISVNGEHLDDYLADGLLVSTPTGATAYALSCGCPIVHPDVPVLLFTPICAHSLRARPVIVTQESTIVAGIVSRSLPALICADGREVLNVDSNAAIKIHRALNDALFIRLHGEDRDFYHKVYSKLVDRTQ